MRAVGSLTSFQPQNAKKALSVEEAFGHPADLRRHPPLFGCTAQYHQYRSRRL